MNRDKQEMALWRRVFEHWYRRELYEIDTCGNVADAAVAEFRKRYPAEPTEPAPVWYDEPPFDKNDQPHPCWLLGYAKPVEVAYLPRYGWQYAILGMSSWRDLAGRRVCPIVKPQEPPQ